MFFRPSFCIQFIRGVAVIKKTFFQSLDKLISTDWRAFLSEYGSAGSGNLLNSERIGTGRVEFMTIPVYTDVCSGTLILQKISNTQSRKSV